MMMNRTHLRPIVCGALLAAAFIGYTSYRLGAHFGPHGGDLEITEAAGPAPLDAEEQNNVQIYHKVLPSVVNITSTTVAFDFFYGEVPQEGQGSGFIVDKEGHILTNAHVIENAHRLEVTLDNHKKYAAEVIGIDKSHDLAVIQIKAPELQPATLGDSRGLQVGQKVYAIGNPFGLSGTMTRGIVSSIRQVREPDGSFIDEAIQTDAAINPGNSGGPLLNSRGEVIGINTMILSNSGQSAGIGFAIPISAAKAVMSDLVQFGRVRRPTLGIKALPINPELAGEMGLAADNGLLVMQVTPGSSADKAGVHGGSQRAYLGNMPIMVGGDLITTIDGQPVADLQELAHIMNNHKAGDAIKLELWRGKKRMELHVVLEDAHGGGTQRL
jgi:S1-C subfamily serine protease